MKHTKGPWEINDRPKSDWIFIEPDICQIPRGRPALANARLMAAAPALLETLEALILAFDSKDYDSIDVLDMVGLPDSPVRAAIAKAKGAA